MMEKIVSGGQTGAGYNKTQRAWMGVSGCITGRADCVGVASGTFLAVRHCVAAFDESMKSVYDRMTPEQRARFDAHVARQVPKPHTTEACCAYCDKFIADSQRFPDTKPADLLASGAVAVPNFGWFCSHKCADAYERDFGIRFQRNDSGKVAY